MGVTVLDAQHPFWGASGRNGGFNCLGGAKASHDDIAKKFGQSEMLDYARAERAAVETVGRLVDRLDLDVDRHSDGETHARPPAERFRTPCANAPARSRSSTASSPP